MNVLDRLRIERAIHSYDWWLELRGAGRRQRRSLRSELRANLYEASRHEGARAAVDSLGRTRLMAAEALPADHSRPRWSAGLQAGVAALALALAGTFFTALAWVDGVLATEPEAAVSGSVAFLPGSRLEYAPEGAGFAVTMSPGWLWLVVGMTAFVLVARPWRVLARRGREPLTV